MHGGVPKTALVGENVEALLQGIENLAKHVDTVRTFGVEPIIALNRFITDTEAELEAVLNWCQENHVRIARTNVWEEGGKGGLALAEQVLAVLEEENNFSPLYDVTESIEEKVRTIVQKVYGGKDVQFTDQAKNKLPKSKNSAGTLFQFVWRKRSILYQINQVYSVVQKASPSQFVKLFLSLVRAS